MGLVKIILLTTIAYGNVEVDFNRAARAMNGAKWNQAIVLYQKCLDDYHLFPHARALIYWNMHVAYCHLGKDDDMAESIFGFATYALSIKEEIDNPDENDLFLEVKKRWWKFYSADKRIKEADKRLKILWEYSKDESETRKVYSRSHSCSP